MITMKPNGLKITIGFNTKNEKLTMKANQLGIDLSCLIDKIATTFNEWVSDTDINEYDTEIQPYLSDYEKDTIETLKTAFKEYGILIINESVIHAIWSYHSDLAFASWLDIPKNNPVDEILDELDGRII